MSEKVTLTLAIEFMEIVPHFDQIFEIFSFLLLKF